MSEPAPRAPAAQADPELAVWHRLHPLSPLVRGGRAVVFLVIIAVPRLFVGNKDTTGLVVDAVIAGVVLVAGVVSWLVTRWRVEGGDLRIETGLLRRSSRRYPLRQVQAIDVVQSGIARVLGLAELRLRLASGGGGQGRLSCLPNRDARALRERLLSLRTAVSAAPAAAGSATATETGGVAAPVETAALPAVPAGTGPLVLRVETPQLVSSMLLSGWGILAVCYLVALASTATLDRAAASGLIGSGAAVIIAFATVLWRRFNGDARLTLHRTPQGFALSSGLVETTHETIPYGRVQALRMVEPVLWRPLGWCRVEAALAGKGTRRQEDRAEGSRRRALLPVGTYAQAHAVLALVLDDLGVHQTPPPARARWKSPLSYHHLSIGTNGRCAVTTSGRLRRVSHWVPLDKVQSIRRTQGPVQRALRLATVHLDTAGPRMHAALRDRDEGEADREVARLPAACAAARDAAALATRSQNV